MNERFRILEVDWAGHRAQLLAIRFEVFVREQGVPPELEEDEQDPASRHLLAMDGNGTSIGTTRLLPDGTLGRMAVRRIWRGRGVGSAMLQELLRMARDAGHTKVQLHAQCTAEPFYARHGFEAVGEVFEEAGIPHRCMQHRFDSSARL